jgi:hypothetical protein
MIKANTDLLRDLTEFLKGELKRERERNEYLEGLILSKTGYLSNSDESRDSSSPVIQTMRRSWNDIAREMERRDRERVNAGRLRVTESVEELEKEVL